MRIAVLHPSYAGSASPFKDYDRDYDPARHLPEHDYEQVRVEKSTAVRQLIELAHRGCDVAVNLCDGAWDEDRPGIEVVQALERLQIAFTGADSAFYDPSREAMKMACHAAGGRFPAYVLARTDEDVARAAATLDFPLIVKHPQSYSSVGLTRSSRVADASALQREAARMIQAFGRALIEEFIEGREFTVLVTEPRPGESSPWVLQPVELLFPPGESFKHFDLIWVEYDGIGHQPVADADLAAKLRDLAGGTFAALNGSGYGRCDIRMDREGQLYLLEVNPNCGVFAPADIYSSADLILNADPAGPAGFLRHLLDCAVRRRERSLRNWDIRFHKTTGFGLYATRAIRAGERIERYEERPQTLVSRRHVERTWTGLRRQWFDQYAWPLTHDLYAMWSANPDDWRPVNHACDPNTWLDGLDVAARRPIACGESLTMEYATFCGPEMAPFECRCGAANCRGTIRGSDHLLPEIRAAYAGHVSAFIQAAWNAECAATRD